MGAQRGLICTVQLLTLHESPPENGSTIQGRDLNKPSSHSRQRQDEAYTLSHQPRQRLLPPFINVEIDSREFKCEDALFINMEQGFEPRLTRRPSSPDTPTVTRGNGTIS